MLRTTAPCLLLLAACSAAVEPAPPAVVVVVIDTLRQDALGCYGQEGNPSPAIDALAASGVRFEEALSSSGWTLPSVASLLTGTWPGVHRALGKKTRLTPISPDVPTAAEILAGAGWSTRAVANAAFLSPMLDLDRGFEEFDHRAAFNQRIRRADESVDVALAQVDACAGEPLFLVLHVFDPHLDFDPPLGFAEPWVGERDEPATPISYQDVQGLLRADGRRPPAAEDVAYLRGQYLGEVAFVDRAVARLVDGLRELGRYEDTLLVITADHGEEFWEHGGFEHGHSLYDELVRVPLIVKPPRGREVSVPVVPSQVRVLDVLPTAFELFGVEQPPSFVGQSLAPLWEGRDGTDRPAWLEGTLYGGERRGLRTERYTYLRGTRPDGTPVEEVYDWRTDPAQGKNLATAQPDLLEELRGRFRAFEAEVQELAAGTRAGEARDVTPRTSEEFEESLRSLGYVGREDGDESGDEDTKEQE